MGLKGRELKDIELKSKREIEELFFRPIMVSIDDMDKFEEKEMRIRPIKSSWYDWLISYIPKPVRKSVVGFKDKIVCLFKTNTPKQTVYRRRKKLSKPKTQNISNPFILKKKDRIIRDRHIWTLFETEKEKKERNQTKKKNLIKD